MTLSCFRDWEDVRRVSSRFSAVLSDVEDVRKSDPFAKFVVFSQHLESLKALKSCLDHIDYHQDSRKYSSVIIEGSSLQKASRLKIFNEDPECTFCLLTTGSGASGLTLTVSYVCYMLEPIHNAAEEAQALSRVHRIGQTHSVRCVIFYAKDTYEERLLSHRKETGTLTSAIANSGDEESVFDSTIASATSSTLTVFNTCQLAHLFGCSEHRRNLTESHRNDVNEQPHYIFRMPTSGVNDVNDYNALLSVATSSNNQSSVPVYNFSSSSSTSSSSSSSSSNSFGRNYGLSFTSFERRDLNSQPSTNVVVDLSLSDDE